MTVKEFKEKAHQLIANGKLEEVIDLLYHHLQKASSFMTKTVAVKANLWDTVSKYNNQLISYDDYSRNRSKAINQVLHIIDVLTEEDFNNQFKKISIRQVNTSIINVVLKMHYTGHEMILDIPENMMAAKFKNELVAILESDHDLCFTLENGVRLATCLRKSNNVPINDNLTLQQNKVKDGDELRLIAYMW